MLSAELGAGSSGGMSKSLGLVLGASLGNSAVSLFYSFIESR
jgi:hypothetical protein